MLPELLTDEHLAILNKVLASCANTEQLCAKCAACGIDVEPERRQNQEQAATAAKIKAQFFPHVV